MAKQFRSLHYLQVLPKCCPETLEWASRWRTCCDHQWVLSGHVWLQNNAAKATLTAGKKLKRNICTDLAECRYGCHYQYVTFKKIGKIIKTIRGILHFQKTIIPWHSCGCWGSPRQGKQEGILLWWSWAGCWFVVNRETNRLQAKWSRSFEGLSGGAHKRTLIAEMKQLISPK